MTEYDTTDDSVKSYYAAIAAKKARGDTHYPQDRRSAMPAKKKTPAKIKRLLHYLTHSKQVLCHGIRHSEVGDEHSYWLEPCGKTVGEAQFLCDQLDAAIITLRWLERHEASIKAHLLGSAE